MASKNIFLTGGNRGIGLKLTHEILKHFHPEHLIVTYRDPKTSTELLNLALEHKNLHPIQFDVNDLEKLPEIVAETNNITGENGLNLLINNSGILHFKEMGIRDVTLSDLSEHIQTNTYAPIFITQAFLPLIEKAADKNATEPCGIRRAAIVNITTELASIAGNASGGTFSYRVSKTALNMATKGISLDLQNSGIVTVLIHPGWVQTDMGGKAAPTTVQESVDGIVNVLQHLTAKDNGKFLKYNGQELAW